jgi:REP-associated tyrosine transposase
MTEYRRYRIKAGCYFFTVNLAERNRALLVEHVGTLREAFRNVRQKHPFSIDAMVVLPEHLHCIWTLPEGDDEFSLRWRQIKAEFSRNIESVERISNSRALKQERGIWQRRFWEHCIRDEDDFMKHVDYIHFNPVKHGLVKWAQDWPYSSFHRYVKRGILPVNWSGANVLESDLDLE